MFDDVNEKKNSFTSIITLTIASSVFDTVTKGVGRGEEFQHETKKKPVQNRLLVVIRHEKTIH